LWDFKKCPRINAKMYQGMDGETGETTGLTASGAFDDKSIRRGFIRKVYGILTCQLAVTMVRFGLYI
jgi:FtsH-binding integral membrane protein